jgi:hypothetical protein
MGSICWAAGIDQVAAALNFDVGSIALHLGLAKLESLNPT